MRRFVLTCVLVASASLAEAAALPAGSGAVTRDFASDRIILAQSDYRAYSGSRQMRPRPATRPNGYRPGYRPPGAAHPGYRPGYRPPGAYNPGYRPGYAPGYRPGYRPGYPGYRPGYRPPPAGWRPAYPGWRPGWTPAPWYGSYWRPGYGWGVAAGLVAVGVLAATAATAYSVPPPPNPNLCWFYTDETYQTGYWAACPPPP